MKIVILADSYGGHRVHNNVVEVGKNDTFPVLIKEEFSKHEFLIDFISFRKITDMPALVEKHIDADVIIVQSGIVDAYPRVISHHRTISQTFFNKFLRKAIRVNRPFFIKYIRSTPWTGKEQFKQAIRKVLSIFKKKIIWINIAPVNQFQENDTPGANQAIKKYNDILKSEILDKEGSYLIDVHSELISKVNYEKYLHTVDSHLNIAGNKLYASLISQALKTVFEK